MVWKGGGSGKGPDLPIQERVRVEGEFDSLVYSQASQLHSETQFEKNGEKKKKTCLTDSNSTEWPQTGTRNQTKKPKKDKKY